MNLRMNTGSLKQLGLFGLLTTLWCFTGCRKSIQEVGLGIQPEDELLSAHYTDSLTIQAFTETEDSLKSDELSSVLFGSYRDPATGYHTAAFYTQFRLSSGSAQFPLQYEIDSVVLSLAYNARYYGRLGIIQPQVYEVTEDLSIDSVYWTFSEPACNYFQNLVDESHGPYLLQPAEPVIVGTDTVAAQLRIKLKNSFGEKFFKLRDFSYSSNARFQQDFKGLRVGTSIGDAAIVNLILTNSNSRLTLFYRNLDGPTPDTTSYSFVINDLCARFSHLDHYYAGSELNGIGPDSPADGQARCFVQAGGALVTRLEFPHITSLAQQDRTINLAELVLPVDKELARRHAPPPQLFILGLRENNTTFLLPDQTAANHNIGGLYDAENAEYRFNITRWAQKVLAGEFENYGLRLVSGSAGVSVNRVAMRGPQYSSDPSLSMRLRVIYTE